MKRILFAVVASLIAGMAVGAWLTDDADQSAASTASVYFDPSASAEQRLAALEEVVAQERNARVVLEDQIAMLLEEIERIDAEGPQAMSGDISAVLAEGEAVVRVAEEDRRTRRTQDRRERQLERLVENGFPESRASWIMERASEYQWEAMQAQYEAQQAGDGFDWTSPELNPEARLRQELGDMEYEQYLVASGQSSTVAVQSVMATSPASQAGLQPGDQILSYDGQRIFNMRELRAATSAPQPGTDVIVEIVRDGTQMQMALPGGPMGITANGRWAGPNRIRGGN